MTGFAPPAKDCALCPRLAAFRSRNRALYPDKFNGAVPSFGDLSAQLLITGLAPGLQGANFTGRPFTGDWAGDMLYATLLKTGFAEGVYGARADDRLSLRDCRITNAVRCVPPENKPVGAEIKACGNFLEREIAAMKNLSVIIALGTIAHTAVLRAANTGKMKDFPFGHGRIHTISPKLTLVDSYHCSRYNTNTGTLTQGMFDAVFIEARALLSGQGKKAAAGR